MLPLPNKNMNHPLDKISRGIPAGLSQVPSLQWGITFQDFFSCKMPNHMLTEFNSAIFA